MKVKVKVMVKVKVIVNVWVIVMGIVLGTQKKFHENLLKIRHAGPSE